MEVWPGPVDDVRPQPDPEILPRRVILPDGVRLWKEVLREERVGVEERKEGEMKGGLQLVFPSSSS